MLPALRNQLRVLIENSLSEFFSETTPSLPVEIETTNDHVHGDLSCTIALRLAKALKQNPYDLARRITDTLQKNLPTSSLKDKIKAIEAKNPGFINFFLQPIAFYDILYEVFEQQQHYGRSKQGQGLKVQIEFVSANPTGPLSVAHARQAAVGDALGNILEFAGFDVTKEYYVNDEGSQINALGRSMGLRAREILGETIAFPQECYQGDYIRQMAREFIERYHIQKADQINEQDPSLARFGVDYLLAVISKELKDFGVHFDTWVYQSKMATAGNIDSVLAFLEEKGLVYHHQGAQWFKSTAFGDDKDRVVKKSDGSFTYLAPDIVYHRDKYQRGFTKIINIWGPDHHGYIPRLKAAVQALGHPSESLHVRIVQLATIYKDGQPLSMSTRRGQFISLREVINEVGVDVARYFFLMRHLEAHLDFDLELAKKETPENPVYYIQYAHARIQSIMDFAKPSNLLPGCPRLKLLKEPSEIELMRLVGFFPDIITICVDQLDPYALTSYLLELATAFHKFYDQCRVIGEDLELSKERLALIEAVKIVLVHGLNLLGIRAPQKM